MIKYTNHCVEKFYVEWEVRLRLVFEWSLSNFRLTTFSGKFSFSSNLFYDIPYHDLQHSIFPRPKPWAKYTGAYAGDARDVSEISISLSFLYEKHILILSCFSSKKCLPIIFCQKNSTLICI